MNVAEFFAEHYLITTLVSVALLIFMQCDCMDNRSTMSNFSWATVCVLLLVAAEMVDNYCAALPEPTTMRIFASAVAYIARPAIAYFIAMVSVQAQAPRLARVLHIPLVADALISFSALFFRAAFYFDDGNHFHRGPLGFTPFVVAVFYLAVLLYYCFLRIRKSERMDSIICCCGTAICLFAVAMEFELGYVGMLPALSVFGEIFYYMYLLMTKYSTDYLTGAYVRSHMYKEVEIRTCDRFYITFDVNGLKRINDHSGHAAGDEALVTFSKAVFDCLPHSASFYRLGGDEFAVIYRTSNVDAVNAVIRRIESRCGSLPYSFSFGYARFTGSADFDTASIEADEMLYKNKREYWAQYIEIHKEEAMRNHPGREQLANEEPLGPRK